MKPGEAPVFPLFPLETDFSIDRLHAVYYSELGKDHQFHGEQHDFWELMYVSRGIVLATIEDSKFVLNAEEAILITPGRFHTVFGNGRNSSDVMTISFACDRGSFPSIADRTIRSDQVVRQLLTNIVAELGVKDSFTYKVNLFLDGRATKAMWHHALKLYIELMMVHFVRENGLHEHFQSVQIKAERDEDDQLFELMVRYLGDRIHQKNVEPDEVAHHFRISKARLRAIFKKCSTRTFKEYSMHLKVEKAKILLRETNSSVTEVSELLGYTTIHYFSEAFKALVGLSPLAYRNSLFVK